MTSAFMLPKFRYHPNPIATGNVKRIDAVCDCCGTLREYIYTGPIHAREKPRDSICPWCIADGSASHKFKATFCDAFPLWQAGLSEEIIREVTQRTPGYVSWQQDRWMTCCDDACEFHGDPTHKELLELKGEILAETLWSLGWEEDRWNQFVQRYEPAGNPAMYKFVCIHCRKIQYGLDFS